MPWAHLGRLAAHPQLWVAAADQLGSAVALVAREDLRYLVVNEAMARLNGVSVQGHIGRSVPEVMGPEHWAWLRPLYERVFAGEEVNTRYTDHDNGDLRSSDIRLAPITEDGEVAAVLVVVSDVSVAEAVRRHSDRLLVLALELNLATDLAEVADTVAAHCVTSFEAVDSGVYWRHGEELVRLSRESTITPTVSDLERLSMTVAVPAVQVARTGEALWLRAAADWEPFPTFTDALRDLGWPVVGVIPLKASDAVRGALYLTFAAGRTVSDHDEHAVHTVAALCAAAVERIVRGQQAAEVADRLRVTRDRLEAIDATDLFGIVRGDATHAHSANGRFLSMLGMPALPDGGLPWSAFTPRRWATEDALAFVRARQGTTGTAYEKEFLHADGHPVPAHVSLVRSSTDTSELTAVVLDLTQVKDGEARVRQTLEERDRLFQVVQTALLPRVEPPRPGQGVRVLAAYQPGDARLALGGDFYDVVTRPDSSIALLVGDVCGHGPLAAAAGAACRIAWRTAILSGADLVNAADLVDRVLRSERMDEDMFATIISATYDPSTSHVQILAAGHPPPVLIDLQHGHQSLGVVNGPLLGVVDHAQHVINRLTLKSGQALMLYTDGLIEGRERPSSSRRLDQEGLQEILASMTADDLNHPQRIIAAANARHGGDLPDDVALLVLIGPTQPPRGQSPALDVLEAASRRAQ